MTEGFPALSALERLFSGVRSLVLNELCVVSKVFPTSIAHVESFSSVNSLVLNKVGALAEGFPTLVTPVRLLCSMGNLVSNEVRDKWEAFATRPAWVGFPFHEFPLEDEEVRGQDGVASAPTPPLDCLSCLDLPMSNRHLLETSLPRRGALPTQVSQQPS